MSPNFINAFLFAHTSLVILLRSPASTASFRGSCRDPGASWILRSTLEYGINSFFPAFLRLFAAVISSSSSWQSLLSSPSPISVFHLHKVSGPVRSSSAS